MADFLLLFYGIRKVLDIQEKLLDIIEYLLDNFSKVLDKTGKLLDNVKNLEIFRFLVNNLVNDLQKAGLFLSLKEIYSKENKEWFI